MSLKQSEQIVHEAVTSDYTIAGASNVIHASSVWQVIHVHSGPSSIFLHDTESVTIQVGNSFIMIYRGGISVMLDKDTPYTLIGKPEEKSA